MGCGWNKHLSEGRFCKCGRNAERKGNWSPVGKQCDVSVVTMGKPVHCVTHVCGVTLHTCDIYTYDEQKPTCRTEQESHRNMEYSVLCHRLTC